MLNLIQFAAMQGAPLKELVALSGYSENDLHDENMRVAAQAYNTVIETAVSLTKDDFFGLHAGEFLNLSAAGLIGQITQTSATVKQALDYCCEFANLGCRALSLELEETAAHFKLGLNPDPLWLQQSPLSVKHTIDGYITFTLREFHTLTLRKNHPIKIYFNIKPPKNIREYERVFNCPVHFSKKET
ncbi:MAG: AraC family transcriptional regulator ligand-binding domain-containing protein, partial [Bacteroidota bacterium]